LGGKKTWLTREAGKRGMGWDNQGDSRCRDILAESQKDYYKVLGVEYDAGEDSIRTNYLRLALKWHPDKHGDANAATLKFQEINEAYRVLSDPVKRYEYDMQGNYALQDYSIAVSISSFLGWLVNFVHSKLYMFYL
jgi:preprotein translocase subunit Sec63